MNFLEVVDVFFYNLEVIFMEINFREVKDDLLKRMVEFKKKKMDLLI